MGSIEEAYDEWSARYDTDRNRTRDLEAVALREALDGLRFEHTLEIGCGTGKNTGWLAARSTRVTAVDLSAGMLEQARSNVLAAHVIFHRADVLQPWAFASDTYDLVTFSLMLEHIEHLGPVLRRAAEKLAPGGRVHIGELHPFKQYGGTKARFTTPEGSRVLTCYVHHVSDFVRAAKEAGLYVDDVREYFDQDTPGGPPRVLVLQLRK